MKRALAIGCAALALTSSLVLAQDAPESLLPPGFDDPAPAPRPSPRPTVSQSQEPSRPASSSSSSSSAPSSPVVQPVPGFAGGASTATMPALPSSLPSVEELEKLGADELDELLGLKPKFDIPPASRRSLEKIGLLSQSEGGMPSGSLAGQPAALVKAAVDGLKGPTVSRWGHILVRRALASRLTGPKGLNPVDLAASRTRALNAMGEHTVARALA